MTRIKHGKTVTEGFYRMFPLSGTRFKAEALRDLAKYPLHVPGDGNIPAGYTYFGQFVAHDISRLARGNEIPTAGPVLTTDLKQLTTPSLDLDSLYGDEFYFGANIPVQFGDTAKFWSESREGESRSSRITDIPRANGDSSSSDKIGDSRNDENFLTAQLHVLFMNLHNKLVDLYKIATPINRNEVDDAWRDRVFRNARRETTFLYQLVLQNDFLYRLLTKNVYDGLFGENPVSPYLDTIPGEEARVPVEFTGAVFRFGHSMIRDKYRLQGNKSTSLGELFDLTGPGQDWRRITDPNNPLKVDWENLFDFSDYLEDTDIDRARVIDMNITQALKDLRNEAPGNRNLAKRNLARGLQLNLPSGQAIASHLINSQPDYSLRMGLIEKIRTGRRSKLIENTVRDPSRISDRYPNFKGACKKWGLWEKMPLWTYILVEPHLIPHPRSKVEQGNLGILGSIIVGEVFRSLLVSSRTSIHDPSFDPDQLLFFDKLNADNMASGIEGGVSHENIIMSDLLHFTNNQ